MLEQALQYLKSGKPIFPVSQDKKPLVAWKDYQKRLPTEEEVRQWWNQWPDANIGMATGALSGIVVVDIEKEGKELGYKFPMTTAVFTGGGGWHLWYKYQSGVENKTRILPFVDIRGEGGYVIMPQSKHASGKTYQFQNGNLASEMAEFPEDDVFTAYQSKNSATGQIGGKDWQLIVQGVGNGLRNETAASFIGKLLTSFKPHEWDFCWQMTKMWNERNIPPLSERELRTTFESISKRQFGRISENYFTENKVILAEEKRKELEELKKNKPTFIARPKIMALDECVDGFRKGQLVIVSGPPKHGKTAFCQTLTKHFTEDGIKTLWFSYELGYEELFAKFPMDNLKFYIPEQIETGNLDWVEEKIKEAKDKFGTEIVFIDHLDFLRDPKELRGGNISQNMASYVGGIVQKVKSLAMRHNLVIFLMCHIRKNQWTSKDLPASEELRDSGQIAQLADIVLMIMRTRTERGSEQVYKENYATLGVIENRHNGNTKKIPLIMVDKEFKESVFVEKEIKFKDF